MDVSVVICTWNRAALLDQTLENMCHLDVPPGLEWELLVVNNNSTDDTESIIARHQGALPLRSLFEGTPGLSNARNRAVGAARGNLVLWTDDDVLVDRQWLVAATEAANRYPHALGFGGPIEPWFPVPPDPDYLAAFPSLRCGFCGVDHDLPEGAIHTQDIFGANMAFRRQAHLDYPFDSSLGTKPLQVKRGSTPSATLAVGGGEEVDLVLKVRSTGAQIVWVPAMRVKHYVDPHRMTFGYLRFHTMDRARQSVRWRGIPPGKRVLGVPRWLLREWLEVMAASWYNALQRNRRGALEKKYRQWQLSGVIRGCLAQSCPTRQVRNHEGRQGGVPRFLQFLNVDLHISTARAENAPYDSVK
jgi:glycosyltransferase involved in cell wall biosynthesis